jgi:3-hydroxyisobutyrate dehydrogenase-like beta-hydroxyacid dehydrogenase
MGYAMAARLLAAGQDVHVWNRNRPGRRTSPTSAGLWVGAIADLADRDSRIK